MIKVLKVSVLLLFIISFLACSDDKKATLPLANVAPIALLRLDSVLLACHSKDDIKEFIHQNTSVISAYFAPNQFKNEAELVDVLNGLLTNPKFNEFHDLAIAQYNLNQLQIDFGQAFAQIKSQYPKYKIPKVVTMFTGFTGGDLLVSDSLIVIGLDYFAGPKAKFKPQVYDYQLRKYQPAYVLPQVINLISSQFNTIDAKNQSMLADMIFFGKSYEFTSQILPNTPDSLIIGYSGIQLDETETAQDLVWGHFIDEQLLYKTDKFTKTKYVGEGPSTSSIGPKCPGSIGRWLGWKIVRKYLENSPQTTLPSLMANTQAQQILQDSKYRGGQ
jgi:hypothetical protein